MAGDAARSPGHFDARDKIAALDAVSSAIGQHRFVQRRAPDVVIESGMTEGGYIPVESRTLETRFPRVYAVGDVATVGVPKAGVFSEGQARVVADAWCEANGHGHALAYGPRTLLDARPRQISTADDPYVVRCGD